jgi:ABC-type transport system involved in Fe-S cluster assembly fused permease/ATPase subunit
MTANPFSTSDKVQALLFEYNSLRSEIMQRNSVFNQYCVISVPASVAAVSVVTSAFPPLGIVLCLVICCLLYIVFRIIEFDTLAAAARVRELEARINEMAGERVLTWETDHGLDTVGYRHRFRYIFDPIFDFARAAMNNRGATPPSRTAEE